MITLLLHPLSQINAIDLFHHDAVQRHGLAGRHNREITILGHKGHPRMVQVAKGLGLLPKHG